MCARGDPVGGPRGLLFALTPSGRARLPRRLRARSADDSAARGQVLVALHVRDARHAPLLERKSDPARCAGRPGARYVSASRASNMSSVAITTLVVARPCKRDPRSRPPRRAPASRQRRSPLTGRPECFSARPHEHLRALVPPPGRSRPAANEAPARAVLFDVAVIDQRVHRTPGHRRVRTNGKKIHQSGCQSISAATHASD